MRLARSLGELNSMGTKGRVALGSSFLVIAIAVASLFGYAYTVYVGRELKPASFAAFGALYGIFYVFCLLGDGLRISVANVVASSAASMGASSAIRRLRVPLGMIVAAATLAIVILAVFSSSIARFFGIDSTHVVLLLAASLMSAILLSSTVGLLQGLQQHGRMAVVGYLAPHGLKLLFALLFLRVGWGLAGAVGALVASNVAAIALGGRPLLTLLSRSPKGASSTSLPSGGLAMPALVAGIVIAVPTSVDVMLVAHYFRPEVAGIYNAVATMGKVVLFLPIAVSLIMLPRISRAHAVGADGRKVLAQSLLYVLIVSGLASLLYWLLPNKIVGLAFGDAYTPAAAYLGLYATAMLVFALNYLFVQYHLAVSSRRGTLAAVAVTLVEIASIVAWHQELSQVIIILLVGNSALLAANILLLRRKQRDRQSLNRE